MEGVSFAATIHVHLSGGRAMAAEGPMGVHRDATSGALEEDRVSICMWYTEDLGAVETCTYPASPLVH